MKVANKGIIRKLTARFLKSGRTRNIVAIAAIVLTSVMFTSVFTLGVNMITTIQNQTMRMVGTSAHGGLKYLTPEQYEHIADSPLLRDISYLKALGVAGNAELEKEYTELGYSEAQMAGWHFALPSTGRMPLAFDEIATSTIVLDALGAPRQIGAQVSIEYTVGGEEVSGVFTLSGYWVGDTAIPAQRIWLSEAYVDSIAPRYDPETDFIAGAVMADVWFHNSINVENKILRLLAERGYAEGDIDYGVNWGYGFSGDIEPGTVAIGLLIIVLILLSGYLIIYSVFAISVNTDIHFYGLLKTIGTTGKQLRRVVRGQALILSALGIPIGLLLGYICGVLLMPVLMNTMSGVDSAISGANPLIFIFAGVFSLLTVFMGLRKPGKIAARVSPVEAVKYSGAGGGSNKKSKKTRTVTPLSMAWANITREKRKLCIVVVSLSLALILLNSAFSASRSFDMDEYMSGYAASDFAVAHSSLFNNAYPKITDGLSRDFLDELTAQGITEMGVTYYRADHEHELSPNAQANFKAQFEDERAEIERYWRWSITDYERRIAEGILPTQVYGFGQLPMDTFYHDYDKLSSGNYALTQTHSDIAVYGVGDVILLTNDAGESREFEIIGVVKDFSYHLSAKYGMIPGQTIMLADNIFAEFFAPEGAMQVNFNVAEERTAQIESWIAEYTTQNTPILDYISRDTLKADFAGLQTTYLLMGGSMSFIFALIGILNFVNAVVASVIARRREFAMLQSVGMTGKQLRRTLFLEGVCHTALTAVFTLTAGLGLSWLIVRVMAGQTWFFKPYLTVMPSVASLVPLLIICAAVPIVCYGWLTRDSLVERLRVE
ncbi:MAG: ABC transporter permease [Oscillospiraceae bacterium]|nr:ABC transporter permease [Oscillospiraceae bacterium]